MNNIFNEVDWNVAIPTGINLTAALIWTLPRIIDSITRLVEALRRPPS